MKKLLIILSTMAIMFADNPVGDWKLSGLRVDYYDIARESANFVVTDIYGAGIELTLANILSSPFVPSSAPWSQQDISLTMVKETQYMISLDLSSNQVSKHQQVS